MKVHIRSDVLGSAHLDVPRETLVKLAGHFQPALDLNESARVLLWVAARTGMDCSLCITVEPEPDERNPLPDVDRPPTSPLVSFPMRAIGEGFHRDPKG